MLLVSGFWGRKANDIGMLLKSNVLLYTPEGILVKKDHCSFTTLQRDLVYYEENVKLFIHTTQRA